MSGALMVGLLIMACCVSAASTAEDYVYKISQGDTMIGLSTRLLNTPGDWPKVARHNRLPNPNYLVPGAQLRVPLALLNNVVATAEVTHVQGDVRSTSSADHSPTMLALGAKLTEGAQVVTGKDGYVSLKLADGSSVRVQSSSQVQVERMRTYPDVGILESVVNLISGRVESLVQKFQPKDNKQTRHSVKTPLANLAVRGTEFRVTIDTQSNNTLGEVLAGVVGVAAEGTDRGAKRLDAGFGSVVDASKSVSDPIALLAAPDLTQLAKLQERTPMRFPVPAVQGARAYRAKLARDESFNVVVLEILSSSPELQIADVADGDYFMRVRAVDAHGLEGYDSTHAFRLKAHPEPPLILNPMPRGKVRAREVEFKWRERTEAAAYHLQIAKDATFTALVLDDKALRGGQAIVGKLALGAYFWRVASLRKDGDRGPFGDVAQFTLLAPPATPTPPSIGDTHINFRWAGEPGQTFEFQIANNSAFEKPILLQTLNSPEIDVPLPRPGPYYMRYRAIDSDGFVGPYIPPQRFMVPEPPFPHSYPAQWMPLYTPN